MSWKIKEGRGGRVWWKLGVRFWELLLADGGACAGEDG